MENLTDSPNAKEISQVELGYLEETANWRLESRFYPSKVGGKPAWLDLLNLPSSKSLECTKCLEPCIFLCQVYAPVEEANDCFHRTIFIFMCLNPQCCEGNGQANFKVFRCQLPRENDFYPYDPPTEDENWRKDLSASSYNQLCNVCGCRSSHVCGKCKKVSYCSRRHQTIDWKTGHKHSCEKEANSNPVGAGFLLPQFEILIENEKLSATTNKTHSDENHQKEIYEKMLQEGSTGTLQEDSTVDNDLLAMAASEEDKEFKKFNECVKQNPDQVLRYEIGGAPLWASTNDLPNVVPNCGSCGGERQFEFQIMPQMLCYLCLDRLDQSIDWGVLVIYTCKNNCSDGPAYKSEFLWKQDFNKTNLPTVE